MAIKAFVESLEGIDETLRGEYEQVEGGYRLSVEEVNGYALENVQGLKSALGKERAMVGDLQKKVTKYEKEYKDIDIDKYKEVVTKYDELLAFDPEKEADKVAKAKYDEKIKKLQKDWESKHGDEVGTREQRIQTLTNQLQSLMVDANASKLLAENGAGESIDLLMPHIKKQVRVVEREGKIDYEIVDNEGNPRVRSDGKNMTLEDLIPEFKTKWPNAFVAPVKSGGGTQASKTTTTKQSPMLSAAEKINAALSKGV